MNYNPPALEKFRQRISWEDLNHNLIEKQIAICVEEDLGANSQSGSSWASDITTNYCAITAKGSAYLTAREPMILCGISLIPLILKVFGTKDITFTSKYKDGNPVSKDESIGTLTGPLNEILSTERSILNFLQRLSGIASSTLHFKKKIDDYGVGLLDTRKTTPGLRFLEKYATACGGGFNHRFGLHDRILIKDNHLAAVQATHGVVFENFFVDGFLICPLFRICQSFKKAKPILFAYLTHILNGINCSLNAISKIGFEKLTIFNKGLIENLPLSGFIDYLT